MGKKHRIERCRKCGYTNNISQMLENNDVDIDEHRENVGYIYCMQCGQNIEIVLR